VHDQRALRWCLTFYQFELSLEVKLALEVKLTLEVKQAPEVKLATLLLVSGIAFKHLHGATGHNGRNRVLVNKLDLTITPQ
jgi:hypothetical protein